MGPHAIHLILISGLLIELIADAVRFSHMIDCFVFGMLTGFTVGAIVTWYFYVR